MRLLFPAVLLSSRREAWFTPRTRKTIFVPSGCDCQNDVCPWWWLGPIRSTTPGAGCIYKNCGIEQAASTKSWHRAIWLLGFGNVFGYQLGPRSMTIEQSVRTPVRSWAPIHVSRLARLCPSVRWAIGFDPAQRRREGLFQLLRRKFLIRTVPVGMQFKENNHSTSRTK